MRKCFLEVLFTGLKMKIAICSWRATKIHLHSKDKGRRDNVHKISTVLNTRRSNFGIQQWLRSHIWFVRILYYKMRQKFITKWVSFFITKCNSYHKMQRCCKMRWYTHKSILSRGNIIWKHMWNLLNKLIKQS